jgi:hypothetical protein
MDYTVQVFRRDRRTKAGQRLIQTRNVEAVDGIALQTTIREIQTQFPEPKYQVRSEPTYTEVKSLMTGSTVTIRSESRGTANDPSMESYWTL